MTNEFPPGSLSGPRYKRGDVILKRGVDERLRIIDVKPMTVVEDAKDRLLAWLPLETQTIRPRLIEHEPGTPRRWVDGNWKLIESFWQWAELLIIVQKDERRETWVCWDAERRFQGWCVNMQSPLRRTHLGFDIWDHQLDILVTPDRSWQWKDQDELDLSVELGRMTAEQAASVREEGARAVADIEANRSPYCDGWEEWAPDGLPRPTMRPAWDDRSMYP
jgi:hypothetical protein